MAQNPWRTGGMGEMPGTPWVKFDTASAGSWMLNSRGDALGNAIVIPIGTSAVFDYLRLLTGPMCWKPFDVKLMVPVGHDMRAPPEAYVDGMAVPILFQGHALAKMTTSSAYVNNALYSLHSAYTFAGPAQAGKLPVYRIDKSEPVYNAKFNQNFFAPRLELIGWVDRDLEIFGPPLVPPPVPMLAPTTVGTTPWPTSTSATSAIAETPAIAATPASAEASAPEPPPAPPPPSAAAIFGNMQPAAAKKPARSTAQVTPKVLPVP